MLRQLPADCLNDIFEYLEDKVGLRSCLLVNRFWCKVSVRILWRNIQSYNTLISCLPNESKELLYENDIIISTQPLLFDYVTFIKAISIKKICEKIYFLQNNDENKSTLVTQELFKMLMNKISLKELDFYIISFVTRLQSLVTFSTLPFTTYPKATECLRNLSKLDCSTDIDSEFFCQMSQICYNLQSLHITIFSISDGLADFISSQRNLKDLCITNYSNDDFAKIILSMTNLSNDLIKLYICH